MSSEGSRPARRPNSSRPRGVAVDRSVSDKTHCRSAAALPESFLKQIHCCSAESLIGTELVWEKCSGIVVETEAYLVEGDEASHTFKRPSARAFVERNKPGAAYIYFNYGVHWMLNVLVKGGPRDGLILVWAIEPRRGQGDHAKAPRRRRRRGGFVPARGNSHRRSISRKRHHEIDLSSDPAHCFQARPDPEVSVVADRRIGISRAKDFPWRYTLRGSQFLSVPVRTPKLSSRARRSAASRNAGRAAGEAGLSNLRRAIAKALFSEEARGLQL